MDITPTVEALRRYLRQAAAAGGEDVAAAAERLSQALEPAVRLSLLEALSQAAADITDQLAGSTVEVRLQGSDPRFVVTRGAAASAPDFEADEGAGDADAGFFGLDDSDEPVARITLRLPESLKQRAEELAAGRGQSLNTWLVNAARAAATIKVNVSATPFGPGAPGRNRSSNKRIQGWVR